MVQRRPVGLIVLCIYLTISGLLLLQVVWVAQKAGISYVGDLRLVSSYVGIWLALMFGSIYSPALQALFVLILAAGIWFLQQWARLLAITYSAFAIVLKFLTWGIAVRQFGIDSAHNPMTLGTIGGVWVIIYLLRDHVRTLFNPNLSTPKSRITGQQ